MSHSTAYSGKRDPINCPANQAKPRKEDAATPATGEWTGITLSRLIQEKGYNGVADAHNAAVAAERDRADKAAVRAELAQIQLADEREHGMDDLRALTHATINRLEKENQQLRDALTQISIGTHDYEMVEVANAALAKVKEGK